MHAGASNAGAVQPSLRARIRKPCSAASWASMANPLTIDTNSARLSGVSRMPKLCIATASA